MQIRIKNQPIISAYNIRKSGGFQGDTGGKTLLPIRISYKHRKKNITAVYLSIQGRLLYMPGLRKVCENLPGITQEKGCKGKNCVRKYGRPAVSVIIGRPE